MWSSKVTASSKRLLSKHVVFPERHAYFTYGDLHASGIKIHAIQLVMPKCKHLLLLGLCQNVVITNGISILFIFVASRA